MNETSKKYTMEQLRSNIEKTYGDIITQRKIELGVLLQQLESKEQEKVSKETVSQ